MQFFASCLTDKGIRRAVNQDSLLLLRADTALGEAVFAVVCDGMGGLKNGELASAELVLALRDWFCERLPLIISSEFSADDIFDDWDKCIDRLNTDIYRYSYQQGYMCGTTVSGVLILADCFYILNVGDSRVYLISYDRVRQLTHDHTFIQGEIDEGRLTPAQALRDSRRNILTRCVGMINLPGADYYTGRLSENQLFLVCSDGFRHVISEEEMKLWLKPEVLGSDENIRLRLWQIIEEIMRRGETDNISAAAVRSAASYGDEITQELPKITDESAARSFVLRQETILINTEERIN